MSACERGAQWQLATRILEHSSGRYEVEALNSAISACGRAAQWQAAIVLLTGAAAARSAPGGSSAMPEATIVTFNAAAAACAPAGRWEVALEVLRLSKQAALALDNVGYSAVLSACAEGAQWARALRLLNDDMRAAGLLPDAVSRSSAVNACAKGHVWELALHVLAEMPSPPHVAAWNAAMTACERAEHWLVALGVLGSLRSALPGAQLLTSTLNAGLQACARGLSWTSALALLAEAAEPDETSFTIAIAMSGGAPLTVRMAMYREAVRCGVWPGLESVHSRGSLGQHSARALPGLGEDAMLVAHVGRDSAQAGVQAEAKLDAQVDVRRRPR